MGVVSHRKWVVLITAFLTAFELHFLLFSFSQLVSEIRGDLGLPYAQANLVFSISVLALVLFRIPWGLLSDRAGSITMLKVATTLIGVFGLLRGFAVNYEALLVYQFLLGFGFAAILPSLPKLVGRWFPTKLGLATGMYVAGFPIGEVAALTLTPFLLSSLRDWRNVFRIYGVFSLFVSALWWTLTDTDKRRRTLRVSLKEEFTRLLSAKEIWILTGLCICAMGCYDTLVVVLPDMLKLGGASSEFTGVLASLLPVGFLVAGPTIGTLSDRVGVRRPFLLLLGLLSGPAIVAIGHVSDFFLWVPILVAGFCTAGIVPLVLLIPSELPKTKNLVASSVGWISALGNVGPFLFPIAVGYIKDISGSYRLAMIPLAIAAEIPVLLGFFMRETGKKRSLQTF